MARFKLYDADGKLVVNVDNAYVVDWFSVTEGVTDNANLTLHYEQDDSTETYLFKARPSNLYTYIGVGFDGERFARYVYGVRYQTGDAPGKQRLFELYTKYGQGVVVALMRNNEEPEVVHKAPVTRYNAVGTLRTACSVIDPVITMELDVQSGELPDINYMYIAQFKRYYFINNVVSVGHNLWEIHAHVDVLKSYSEQIDKQTAVIARAQNSYNLKLNDGVYPAESAHVRTIKKPTGFTPGTFDKFTIALTVIGGGDSV